MNVRVNVCLNRTVRMLDGQWQGLRLATDGRVYFFGGSHNPGVSAPFFRYDPATDAVDVLALDMSRICGEDPAQVPTQGKVHSDLLEHHGRLYFGTHLSDYTPAGCAAYTGAHLVSYETATGGFRDYGVIHPNYTNYSGLAIDAARNCACFYATPFSEGDGPHLHRIDLDTGENRDLGLVAPWVDRQARGKRAGQPCAHLFVDARGDCWFTLRGEYALFVARADGRAIERHDGALPGGASQWTCMRPLDADRALVILPDGFYVFDGRRFGNGAGAFERFKAVDTPGLTWAYMALDRERLYWNSRTQQVLPETGCHETRIWSTSLNDPSETVDHGAIAAADGHLPWFVGDLVSDGRGRIYTCGRWYAGPEEFDTIGVNRNGLMCAAYFSVLEL